MSRLPICLAVCMLLSVMSAAAYESAFAKTPPGKLEIKTIPASTLLKTQAAGDYFANSNQLFSRLFRYISDNDVAMTVPVKADIEPGAMYFYVGQAALGRGLKSTDSVTVVNEPARQVASIGVRGGYSEERFRTAQAELLSYLQSQPGYRATGKPYGIYWDGPFTLWFRKAFEVHIPVEERKEP